MSSKRIHKYFDRKPAEWSMLGFLNECHIEPFKQKIDEYLKSLANIMDCGNDKRHEKAKLLFDRYRKDTRPDRQIAKDWDKGHKAETTGSGPSSIYFQNSTFLGSGIETINHGTYLRGNQKIGEDSAHFWQKRKLREEAYEDDAIDAESSNTDTEDEIINDSFGMDEPIIVKPARSVKKVKPSSNIDFRSDDDVEDIDFGVDPNIIFPESENGSEMSVCKYPAEDSSPDVWLLPSGISAAKAICGPSSLPSAHPSHIGIIRVGPKLRRPDWIQQVDWKYLWESAELPVHPVIDAALALFQKLAETESREEYGNCIRQAKSESQPDKQMTFFLNVLEWFADTVFNPDSAFHSPRAKESVLGSLLVHPVLQYLINTSDSAIIYLPGEIYLDASANQRMIRRHLMPEDGRPLGLKVDGIFQSPGKGGLEIGFLEMSGGHMTHDMPRYLKDHVRGCQGERDILDNVAAKLKYGDYQVMRRMRTWFLHTHGRDVQVWGMDLPVKGVYRMILAGNFRLPIDWEDHHELLHSLPILWNLGKGLKDTVSTLEEIRKSHRQQFVTHSKISRPLKAYIGEPFCTPTKPKGKKSRSIDPFKKKDLSS
ncbi:hypothetical protein G9A89_012016 [Geosiphon pyriformis]|nr:hypothetical protein G9A89_012016 [Geosiphon pyriformis]